MKIPLDLSVGSDGGNDTGGGSSKPVLEPLVIRVILACKVREAYLSSNLSNNADRSPQL